MIGPPPLTGLKVLEFAGLAPGPFAGLLLADAGASVLRIDRPPNTNNNNNNNPTPTPDLLTRHKASIAVDLKSPSGGGRALVLRLARHADVLIDPFRPGVMERLGLGPEVFLPGGEGGPGSGSGSGSGSDSNVNPRLVYARLTGFRRDGRYRDMAGHDINYLSVSGVLGILGGAGAGADGGRPAPPANILGDFAGGGAVLFQGILMALVSRGATGRGQVVEANMVDGAGYLATSPRLLIGSGGGGGGGPGEGEGEGVWGGPRGTNLLDGGCPYYGTYGTADGGYVAVGALEPRFFAQLVAGLGLAGAGWEGRRHDRSCWAGMRAAFGAAFGARTRDEWEAVFDGTDACCTPVLGYGELRRGRGREGGRAGREGDQRPVVTLRGTPCLAVDTAAAAAAAAADLPSRGQGSGVPGDGYTARGLRPGENGEERLREWLGWERGRHFDVEDGGLVLKITSRF